MSNCSTRDLLVQTRSSVQRFPVTNNQDKDAAVGIATTVGLTTTVAEMTYDSFRWNFWIQSHLYFDLYSACFRYKYSDVYYANSL